MRDFTLKKYHELLLGIKASQYTTKTVFEFVDLGASSDQAIVLRHDVDKHPYRALMIAQLEQDCQIKSTYYFRINKQSFDETIMREIHSMGHEIGYHYEDLSDNNGNYEDAWRSFKNNLSVFSAIAPVKTISMHGAPLSKWDNRSLWNKYSYKELGIAAEVYLDIDYDKTLYYTDTGRSWNNRRGNIRDKIKESKNLIRPQIQSTDDLIRVIGTKNGCQNILINTHPQRWNDSFFYWVVEFCSQNIKNLIKKLFV